MSQWAVIMAGGVGKRFWPLSLQHKPKQFLSLGGEDPLILTSLKRLERFYPKDQILIVASEQHRESLREALPDFRDDRLLWEPLARNTAPCIAWATETIYRWDPDATIGVYPSDHAIGEVDAFTACVQRAHDAASDSIVLFGIQPTRPETGYGYIEIGKPIETLNGIESYDVKGFKEKPHHALAEEYLQSGQYLWNGGIFVYKAAFMRKELQRLVPEIFEAMRKASAATDDITAYFEPIPSISIDYAVMEKTDKAQVLRTAFAWNDIGSWATVRDLYEPDAHGNIRVGDAHIAEGKRVFVHSSERKFIATLGVDNLIIVNTKDAILITTPEHAQEVRSVVEHLEKEGRDELL